jgi:transcriptional regulator with XRE-family HTH domain
MQAANSPTPSLGSRIRDRRIELRWTQDVLAEKAGISKGFLSDLENNNRSVGAERLLDLARVLGVSLDYLMKGEVTVAAQEQIIIPQRLADFAKQIALPFNETLTLLEMRRQIIAHRSMTRSENPEDFDWERFYKSVKDFLP